MNLDDWLDEIDRLPITQIQPRHILDLSTEELRRRALESLDWHPDLKNQRGIWFYAYGCPEELRRLVREHGRRNVRSGYALGAYRCAGWRYYVPDTVEGEINATIRRISERDWVLNLDREKDSFQRRFGN